MKVLVTGKGGQLSWELEQCKPSSIELLNLGIAELDITKLDNVLLTVGSFKPDVIINAAAYTAVDKAELERNEAFSVNEVGAQNLAFACQKYGARMLHVSTDFVFDGKSTTPHQTDAIPSPINVYGASKLAGDMAVQKILPCSSVIVRTAWVYSSHGKNFVKTMLRLMSDKPELRVIYDQVGTPTWAKGLARWLWMVTQQTKINGLYHWTDAGVASWYDFAIAIQELALEKGLLYKSIPIIPISTSEYPTPAKRPSFSVIDKSLAEEVSGIQTVHWRKQLSMMMDEFKANYSSFISG
ncbi:dTDP-4-dehydrorhamnose reductase [Shewanella sp.]|uniref:dTDP-4-dehydrorhamnose reductase n=1 Tax=Shewanella sp. TaxID=50422 RepID=UPI003D0BFE9D